jgi:Holliday junction resolvase RusA-like endonuclease
MSAVVDILALGTPAPKGSPRIVTRGRNGVPLPFPRVLKDSKKTEVWEADVSRAAMRVMRGYEGRFKGEPLAVDVVFALARPQGHYGKRGLRRAAPIGPSVKPDFDKLLRSTLDALSGIVFDDDARIVTSRAAKVYTPNGFPTGALIRVSIASPEDLWQAATRFALAVDRAADAPSHPAVPTAPQAQGEQLEWPSPS